MKYKAKLNPATLYFCQKAVLSRSLHISFEMWLRLLSEQEHFLSGKIKYMEDLSNYEKLKEDARSFYNSTGKINSPALNQDIYF